MTLHTNTPEPHDGPAQRDDDVDLQVQRAIEALEEDIVLGYLYPRERLIEDNLRARFNLKRHVVRQVLSGLEQMGLVERKKNIGALVKSYTEQEVLDLYQTREILETNCARLIPTPISKATLEELKKIQRMHDEAVKHADLKAAFRSNLVFHKALFGLCENRILTTAIEEYAQRTHIIRSASHVFPDYLEKARQDHWDMIAALGKGDHEQLVETCRAHLLPARDAYIVLRQRERGLHEASGQ